MPKIKKEFLPLLGTRMQAIRKELRLSQRELAQKLSVTNGYISEIENGHSSPGYEFFRLLFSTFPVNPDYLFLGEGEMFRRGSISPIPKPNAREIVEVGEILTLDDIIALVEISATFKHKLFGYVSDFIVTHKSLLLNAISHKEKKAREEQNK